MTPMKTSYFTTALLLSTVLVACGAEDGRHDDVTMAEVGDDHVAGLDAAIEMAPPAEWVPGTCDPRHVLPVGVGLIAPEALCVTPECDYLQQAAALGAVYAGDPVTGRRYAFDLDPDTGLRWYSLCLPDDARSLALVSAFADDPVLRARPVSHRCADGAEVAHPATCADVGRAAEHLGAIHDPLCNGC